MKTIALALILLPALGHAQTDSAVLTCTAATTNSNGSVFSAAQKPVTYKFYEGTVSGTYPNASPAQTTCAYTFTGLAPGAHFFVATTVDKLGAESARSNMATKTVPNPTPSPPTGLTVAADLTAYTIVQTKDRIALVAVGNVAPGTACDATQPVLTKFVVPLASVTFIGTVRPQVVLAACG